MDFRVKNVRLSDSEAVTVQLWDTAGQERFRSIASSYFRKADGVILLYDVTSPSSFISVRDWMERITVSFKTANQTWFNSMLNLQAN